MINSAEILLNDELTTALAQLYCRKKFLNNFVFEPITVEQVNRLAELGLIDEKLTIIHYDMAYAAFEHYRQNICPEPLDIRFLQEIGENKVVLDLCCGSGATIRALHRRNDTQYIYAFDHEPFCIETVQQLAAALEINDIHAQVAEATCLPVGNEAVDIVISRVALQYLDINRVLDEITRVLKNNGSAVLMVHGSGYVIFSLLKRGLRMALGLLRRGLEFNILKKQSRTVEIFLTPFALKYLLRKRGFDFFSVSYSHKAVNYGPLPLYFMIKCSKTRN